MKEHQGESMGVLQSILNQDNMRLAWEEVADGRGAPGIDGISIRRWRRRWEERLANLAQSVRTNTYNPSTPRTFSIPKKDGSLRRFGIPTVTDRVLQRAVLRVIDDIFDSTFHVCSYGYRSGRGVRDAIPAIIEHRKGNRRWVLDADIDDCFDSLDHALLLEFFEEGCNDPTVVRLIRQWIESGKRRPDQTKGIILGAVISPLLCNIYLHMLDDRLIRKGYAPIRYADDFCVFCHTEVEAKRALADTDFILKSLRLRLEPRKTSITNFDHGFDYLGVHFQGNCYSFFVRDKEIEIEGEFDRHFFYDYVPEGYS